jgi:hypothetical protein
MDKLKLRHLYLEKKLSSNEIAQIFQCSEHKINYWLNKFGIEKRTISEATYCKYNPKGDPFSFSAPKNRKDIFLFGLGLGLFWGEGSKRDSSTLKICNSDPKLIKKFIDFLVKIYSIDKKKLRFQLQIYNDFDVEKTLLFWANFLKVEKSQFYKTTILIHRGNGTYNRKMQHGVLIVHFHNVKLKDLICSQIANIKSVL